MSSAPPRATAKVAVCQLLATHDPDHNLRITSSLVRRAASAGASAVFLPEAADFISRSSAECRALSFPLSQHPYVTSLRALAKDLGVVISVGVHDLPEEGEEDEEGRGSERVFNTHVLIGKQGEIMARYRKMHMYDVELQLPPGQDGTVPPVQRSGESDRVRPGGEVVPPVEVTGLGKIGLEICYDLRFPEQSIILTRLGADILTFPSAFFVKTGRDHWATLLRAAAIQHQTFVIASAQYGVHNPSRTSWGESLAFDPWGRQLGRLRSLDDTTDAEREQVDALYADSGELFLCDVGPEPIEETRKQIPLGIQKRKDVYGVVGHSLPAKPL